MHHHKNYMYLNFQQNQDNRSVITVLTNLFAKNLKLHKFATANSNFFKKSTVSFFEKKIYFIQKKTNRQKKYIYTLQNLYTHTINIEHIIYMQESSGQPHIDQYRSKLYSLYTSNDRL